MTNVSTESQDLTMKTAEFQANGNTFSVLEVTGRNNYIVVGKMTNNPFFKGGRHFRNWDEAIAAYKSADMKVGLLLAKCNIY